MSTLTNDLARLANNANVLVTAITTNATAITSVNVAGVVINSSGLASGNTNLVLGANAGISANGSYGLSGQALVTNGSAVYWSSVAVNTNATYAWNNVHTFGANVTINGDLLVTGTTVTINTTTIDVKDKNITVAKGSTASAADGAGITVDGANIGWYYTYASNTWTSNVGITPANSSITLGSSGSPWGGIYGTIQTTSQPNITANLANYIVANDGIVSNSSGVFVKAGSGLVVNATGVHVTAGVNTSAQYTWNNVHTFNANLILSSTTGISANGSYGNSGDVLFSNGSAVFWAKDSTIQGNFPTGDYGNITGSQDSFGINILTVLAFECNFPGPVSNTDLGTAGSI